MTCSLHGASSAEQRRIGPTLRVRLGVRSGVLAIAAALAGCATLLIWQDPNSAFAAGLWIAAVVLLPVAWLRVPSSVHWRRLGWLAALFLVALAPRLLWIDHLPLGLHGDEAAHVLVARNIWRTGLADAFSDHGWGIPAWGFLWQVGFVGLLGPSISAVRAASSVAGALTVVLTFLWARALGGLSVGLIAAGLLLLAHTHLLLSHLGTVNSQAPLLTTLTILLLTVSWQRRSHGVAVLAGSCFTLTFLNWAGDRIIVPVVVAAGASVLVARRNRVLLRPAAMFGLAVCVLAVAPAAYYLRSPDGVNLILARSDKSLLQPEGWDHTLSTVPEPTLQAVMDRQASHTIGGFIPGEYADASTFYRFDRPFVDPLTLVAAGLGIVALARRARPPVWVFPPLVIALTLISTALIVDPPNYLRLSLMLTSIIVLAALGIESARGWLTRVRVPRVAAGGLALAVVGVVAAVNATWFFVDYPREGEGEFTLLDLAALAQEYQLPVYVLTPDLNYNHEDLQLLDPQRRVEPAPTAPGEAASPAVWVAADAASLPRLRAMQSELASSTLKTVTDNRGQAVLEALVPSGGPPAAALSSS